MAAPSGFRKRLSDYKASKTVLFWSCAASVVATIVVGFAWGGWVTGGTASTMQTRAGIEARADLAATICADRFAKGPDAVSQLASLRKADSWDRDKFIREGGWVSFAGIAEPIDGAASLCAHKLIDAKSGKADTGKAG